MSGCLRTTSRARFRTASPYGAPAGSRPRWTRTPQEATTAFDDHAPLEAPIFSSTPPPPHHFIERQNHLPGTARLPGAEHPATPFQTSECVFSSVGGLGPVSVVQTRRNSLPRRMLQHNHYHEAINATFLESLFFFIIITQSVCGQTDVERNRGTLGNFSTMDEEQGGKAPPLPRTASRSCDMTNVSENTSLPVLLLPASVFSRVCRAVSRSCVFISLHVHSFLHPPLNSALIPQHPTITSI